MRQRISTTKIRLTDKRPLLDYVTPVKCPFCNGIFPHGAALNRHVKKMHPQA